MSYITVKVSDKVRSLINIVELTDGLTSTTINGNSLKPLMDEFIKVYCGNGNDVSNDTINLTFNIRLMTAIASRCLTLSIISSDVFNVDIKPNIDMKITIDKVNDIIKLIKANLKSLTGVVGFVLITPVYISQELDVVIIDSDEHTVIKLLDIRLRNKILILPLIKDDKGVIAFMDFCYIDKEPEIGHNAITYIPYTVLFNRTNKIGVINLI